VERADINQLVNLCKIISQASRLRNIMFFHKFKSLFFSKSSYFITF